MKNNNNNEQQQYNKINYYSTTAANNHPRHHERSIIASSTTKRRSATSRQRRPPQHRIITDGDNKSKQQDPDCSGEDWLGQDTTRLINRDGTENQGDEITTGVIYVCLETHHPSFVKSRRLQETKERRKWARLDRRNKVKRLKRAAEKAKKVNLTVEVERKKLEKQAVNMPSRGESTKISNDDKT